MAISNDIEGVDDLLMDVRKSYRFLYEFQRRIMDLISFIGGTWGFVYDKGEPLFCRPPSHKKINPSTNWAWDFLLFYNYNFVYVPRDFGDWKEVRLMLNIVCDTGYYDVASTDKLGVLDFAGSEKAKTEFHIILKTNGVDWADYRDLQYPSTQRNPYIKKDETSSSIIIGQKFDLSSLVDETRVRQCLKEFEELCSHNQISLKEEGFSE